jgi:hypothetical protein
VNIAYAKQHVYIYFMSMTPMDLWKKNHFGFPSATLAALRVTP